MRNCYEAVGNIVYFQRFQDIYKKKTIAPHLALPTYDINFLQPQHYRHRRGHLRVAVAVRPQPLGAAAVEELQHELGAVGDVGSALRPSGGVQGAEELAEQVPDKCVGWFFCDICG